ncbi:hypothetical protein Mal15_14600 [Stieleria maiorica]|uniref:Glycerophosphoryl diester phosphodiesterase membrane domain-containing protein n=1 Tax=Stieleria maiorica TaxID=2795974 RepID=A0A5B9MBG7_9BACT|nr:hypothetical protein [Stieleria maiorica]QEF97420.1 hypothetical protein Mal15_14600 [Stieleria maiorica]
MNKSEIHAGYEFESGMFSRMRSWVDVASWVRLARIPRIMASPSHVGLVFAACLVTRVLVSSAVAGRVAPAPFWELQSHVELIAAMWNATGPLLGTTLVVAMWVLWTPVIQFVCRGGAVLAAGQSMPRAGEVMRLVRSRLWKSFLVPIIPLLCVLASAAAVFVIRVPSFLADVPWISQMTGWTIGIAVIPLGILGFGALFAVPLALAAMVCEPDSDPIDSISRGYEAFVRRPLSLVWYLLLSGAMVFVAGVLLGGVGWAASLASLGLVLLIAPDPLQLNAALEIIATLVIAWQLTLAFGLLGGVYLLLRSDAGGQEPEDLWTPPPAPKEPLPELPKEALQ